MTGNGVYVSIDRGMLCLTTENGIETTNTVYLEIEVYNALTKYVDRIRAAQSSGDTGEPK